MAEYLNNDVCDICRDYGFVIDSDCEQCEVYMSRRKIFDLIENTKNTKPDNIKFVEDIQSAIQRYNQIHKREPSEWYKPSSLKCMRNMYFTRIKAETDLESGDYNAIGMADTGTRRHEAIQEVLLEMKQLGYDWEYLDVAEYVKEKQSHGKCTTIQIKEQCGAETHLFDSRLKISFRCDGIIRKISTNEYFLFEFKNQTSFKFKDKETVDSEHIDQVVCYCTALDLDKAFVVYENRDVCTLNCPEVFIVTDELKSALVEKIATCEYYVLRKEAPPKCEDTKTCRWCNYKTICRKV